MTITKHVARRKRKIGLALVSTKRRREIAAKGGRAAHAKGKAHQFTPKEARKAGVKGGKAMHANAKKWKALAEKGAK